MPYLRPLLHSLWSEPSPSQSQLQVLARRLPAQAQGLPVGPQLAPTPRMRWALPGKGLVQARLFLIKSVPRALRNPVTLLLPLTFPTLMVMLGRSRGCCAPTCIVH